MADPINSDDNWAELYRELNVENAEPAHAPEPKPREERPVEEEVVELTAAAGETEEEGIAPDLESEEIGVIEGEFEPVENETESEPEKKRRRRRRRRKKKSGSNGQPETAEGESEEAESDDTEPEPEEDEPLAAVGVEDEMSPEMTRDIITNWNVPSWQEIVAGLYRPDR